ncbi:hypothetical protein ACQPUZ_12330 [Clostridium tertium]
MAKDKFLPISIFALAISIIIASSNISMAIDNNGMNISNGISQGLNNINRDIFINDEANNSIMNRYTASVYLGISEEILMQIMNNEESKIPYIDINGDVMFSKNALDKWVEESNFKM